MATQHPGGWNALKVKTPQPDPANTTFEVLGTSKNAIHSFLIYNPEFSGTLKWRVLFWRADTEEVDYVKTRIWNPNYENPIWLCRAVLNELLFRMYKNGHQIRILMNGQDCFAQVALFYRMENY
jgi:hypothetical protein